MVIINNNKTNPEKWQVLVTDVEKLEPLYPAGGNVKQYSCYGNSMAGPQKLKRKKKITIWPSNSNSGYKLKRTESRDLNRLCANAQSSTVHKSRVMEAIQMFINKPMD